MRDWHGLSRARRRRSRLTQALSTALGHTRSLPLAAHTASTMSRRSGKAARVEPPRLDGHAHAVYGPWAFRLAADVLEEEFGEAVRVRRRGRRRGRAVRKPG